MTEIIEVNTKKDLGKFIDFPRKLYRIEPNYISDLDLTIKSKLTKRNPFLRESDMALFLAQESLTGNTVGRVAAIYNKAHLDKHHDKCGFFGFFDSMDDANVSNLLLDQVSKWLKSKGLEAMIGPTNLTTNDSCGILVKGFEYPNQVSMPYNYPYYNNLLKSYGFVDTIDLLVYHLIDKPSLEKYTNIMQRAKQRLEQKGMRIRAISAKYFERDVELLRKAYNEFNRHNWGFMPLSQEEFFFMAQELKSIMPYHLALMAEKAGKVIGYIIAVPDFNQVLKKIRNGKLFPFGIFKILRYKRKIDSSRVMLIGINDQYRGTGLDLVLYQEITNALYRENIYQCEAGYVMSTNKTMNSLMIKIGGKPIKQYKLYKKSL